MELLNIYQIIQIIRKYFLRITALSIAVGLIAIYVVDSMQTYTCVLGFKYNHSGAAEGLAPDGESKLNPYEIQNPVVIQGALDITGMSDRKELDLKGLRQSITVNKVVTELDKEVTESAALLGEKYEAAATEYEMTFKYDAGLGDEFGAKMFNGIIKSYDEFLLNKYYNKRTVSDFSKILKDSTADYIDIADVMALELDSHIEYFDSMASWYPDFRSKTTGYSFSELAMIYQNLRNIQYAKYYGNIRAGRLAKDPEMVIKTYNTKVKSLRESKNVSQQIADNYMAMISTFYDPYKAAGLYGQAEKVQSNTDSSNNRDQDVLEHYDIEEHKNTYDNIVVTYVEKAAETSDSGHLIDHYLKIIDEYTNDTVSKAQKDKLISANEKIFDEICVLSEKYSVIANNAINELFSTKVTTDLQYLIVPEVVKDIPVKMVAVFIVILAFGGLMFAVIFMEIFKKLIEAHKKDYDEELISIEQKKKGINVDELDELHLSVYEQYQKGFNEFYLVYQPMINCNSYDESENMEAFIRWKNEKLGMVSPGKIIECISDLDLFGELNEWIISTVCEDIRYRIDKDDTAPIVHINCPHSEVVDFGLNDIIIKCVKKYKIPAGSLCFELDGKDILASMEDILLLKEMGVGICIDHFENSDENQEIISVLEPGYVKMSLDILNYDIYATSESDFMKASVDMLNYLSDVIDKCHDKDIKVCICGVEDKNQDRTVSMMDFDYKQGYFYKKPEVLAK